MKQKSNWRSIPVPTQVMASGVQTHRLALIKVSRGINKITPVQRIAEDDERLTFFCEMPNNRYLADCLSQIHSKETRNCYFHRLPSGNAIAATGYRLFHDPVTLTVSADCVRIFTHHTLELSFAFSDDEGFDVR
jgi:hypothetical protein